MTQPKALILDEIIRIYKNSADRVIGIHCIVIHEQREAFPNPVPGKVSSSRFKRSATLSVHFDRFNLSMGESRIIDKVQMIGKYDDYDYNVSNTDIVGVKYFGDNQTNDLEVSLKNLPTVGETL